MTRELGKWPIKTKTLREDQIEGLRVVYHSHMMEPMFDLFRELVCFSKDYPYINRDMVMSLLLDFGIAE